MCNSKSTVKVVFSSITLFIAVLGLIAYIPGFDKVGRVDPDFIPMAQSTAVSFIILGAAVLFYEYIKQNRALFYLFFILIIIVTIFGLLEIPGHFLNLDLNLENMIVPNYGFLGNVPIARMSPSTGFFFFLLGLSLLLSIIHSKSPKNIKNILLNIANFLILIALLGSIAFLLGYMHRTPLMYSTLAIPMALTTAISFLFLSVASILILDEDCFLYKIFSGDSTRSVLIRAFLPISVIAVILGYVVNDFIAFYLNLNGALAAPLMILIVSIIVAIITGKISKNIGEKIDYFQNKANRAEAEVRSLAKFPSENPYPVLRIGKNKTILYANEAAIKTFDNEDMSVGSFFHRWHELINKAFISGTIQEVAETEENDKIFSWKLVPVIDRFYINIYGMNITARKLVEEKLLQSQKMEAVGQLAGGIAHDFNNLLTIIMGNSQILEKRLEKNLPENSKALENLEGINSASIRAADLTRQLLLFGRKDISRVKDVNINNVINDLLIILHRIISENIIISLHLSENIKSILVDKTQIEQVIMNLIINARDAMPKGGILTIETCNIYLDENYKTEHPFVITGSYIQLIISDTGCGISNDIIEKIFEPFFTTKSISEGTGLGLSTAYGIIKKHDGDIFVYSEPGNGTTFKIYLPVSDIENSDNEIKKTKTYDEKTTNSNKTVLVAEDSDGIQKIVKEQLEGAGYNVLLANNGTQALKMAEKHKYKIDLLLTDVIMPGISGKELYDSLLLKKPKLKVIYMSGYTANVILRQGVLDKNTDFLEKPFKSKELLDIVSKVCRS